MGAFEFSVWRERAVVLVRRPRGSTARQLVLKTGDAADLYRCELPPMYKLIYLLVFLI
jgi:hypothetical protein